MPNPNSPNFDGNSLDFSDAPGADMSLDELFPLEDGLGSLQTTAPPETPPAEPIEPQAPPADDYFLRAGKSVYKTAEDAARGIEHKDAIIEQLRQREISRSGVDPFTGQTVGQPQYAQPQAPQQPINYSQDSKKYYEDLVNAVEHQDPDAYARVQQKFIADVFAPVAPIIMDVAKQRTIESVANEIPEVRKFYGSPEYREVLETMPTLKQAIEAAEGSFDYMGQLPELLKIAYLAGQGRKLPELVKAASAQPPAQPTQPARPTTSPSTIPPPQPTGRPDIRTSEGRKALIAELEGRGVADLKW